MKNLIVILTILISGNLFSQNNVIKIDVLSPTYRDISFSFERLITPKSSVNLTAGYISLDPLLKKYGSELYEEGWQKDAPWMNEINAGVHASLEYRFYMGETEAPKGFYVAPFMRYWNIGFDLDDYIRNAAKTQYDLFDVKGNFQSISGGAQLGYQWIIADRVSIDWYFMGIGLQQIRATGTYKIVPDQNGFDYSTIIDDVTDGWNKIPQVEKNLNTVPQESQLNLSTYMLIPDFRAGLRIGFAF